MSRASSLVTEARSEVVYDDDYNDDYKGPRWTYGLSYRPVGMAMVPDGYIIWSDKEHTKYRFGTLDYPMGTTG